MVLASKISRQLQPALRLSAKQARYSSSQTFSSRPAPLRLPEEEQRRFEELQKASTGAFSTPKSTSAQETPVKVDLSTSTSKSNAPPQVNQSPHLESASSNPSTSGTTSQGGQMDLKARVNADGKGEELHPDIRRGARPEFEGDRNPKTGEVGGPKNEPLRWGDAGDWSYNGRVTDF